MRSTGRCPKCSSTAILDNARVIDRGDYNTKRDLEVAVYTQPEAWIFKGERKGRLAAWVCTGCGFTELYCVDLF